MLAWRHVHQAQSHHITTTDGTTLTTNPNPTTQSRKNEALFHPRRHPRSRRTGCGGCRQLQDRLALLRIRPSSQRYCLSHPLEVSRFPRLNADTLLPRQLLQPNYRSPQKGRQVHFLGLCESFSLLLHGWEQWQHQIPGQVQQLC